MRHVIVVHYSLSFNADWETLSNIEGEGCIFHLITDVKVKGHIPGSYLSCFSSINFLKNFDYIQCRSAVLDIIKTHSIHDLRLIAKDEYSLMIAAKLREELGLEGVKPNEILPFVNKLAMKEIIKKAGITTHKHIRFDNEYYNNYQEKYVDEIEMNFSYPLFTKPVDSTGSVGTRKIDNREEFILWCKEHAECSNYEIDEYISGTLYHIDTIIQKGKMVFSFTGKYNRPNAELLYGFPMGSIVLNESAHEYKKLQDFNAAVLKSFSTLPDGAFHHEVFVRHDGQIIFLEIAARAAGGFTPKMYEKASGINIEEMHFMAQLNKIPSDISVSIKDSAAWIFFPPVKGVIKKCINPIDIQGSYELFWRNTANDKIENPVSCGDRVLGILLWSEQQREVEKDFYQLEKNYIPFELY